MDGQIRLQSWQADVRAVLHQLHRGPSLEDTQLRNLHTTLRPPSPIPTSKLVRDYLPAFLETEEGRDITWNLEFKREDPEDWPPSLSSLSTSSCIVGCTYGLGNQIWGRSNYETKRSE